MPLQPLLDAHGVLYFSALELTFLRQWNIHRVPPRILLGNIFPTVLLADRIRERWKGPVRCLSGYRPPEYNALVGGSPRSQHLAFRAMDITPVSGDLEAFGAIVVEEVEATRGAGQSIGLGHYRTFLHIDCGPTRTWDER